MRFVTEPERQAEVLEWTRSRIEHIEAWPHGAVGIGVEYEGELVIAVVYTHYSGYAMEMSTAIDERGKAVLGRRVLRTMFGYPFLDAKCLRVGTLAPAWRPEILRFNERLGYVHEGVVRKATPSGNYVLFGMLKEECPWIPKTSGQ
jgi:hypothetical protein